MFEIKDGVVIDDMKSLHVNVLFMFCDICRYCKDRDMPVTITSIFSDRDNVKSKSNTHKTFRALDIRTRDWTETQIIDLETYLNIEFRDVGAITKDGTVRAALYHNYHLHIQCRP